MSEDGIDIKNELRAILRYYDQRLDSCTIEEMRSVSNALISNMDVRGTADDFAQFFGKSVDSVRHVLHRKVVDKPKRQVTHSFAKFLKQGPKSWLK